MGCGSSVHVSQPATSEGISPAPGELDEVSSASDHLKEDTFTVTPDPHSEFLPRYGPSALELKCRSTIANLVSSSIETARKKIDDLIQYWKKSGQLADIESYSCTTPPSLSTTTTELSEYLTRSSCNYIKSFEGNMVHVQVAKAYCIYSWIANNITYDNELWQAYKLGDENSLHNKTQAEKVLERRMTVSYGYANLFKSLASKSELKVEVIWGNIKNWKSQSLSCHENEFELSRENAHAWNSVTFGGIAYLIDCTLGSGFISPNAEYQSDFTPQFFCVKPQDFILTHWPSRANLQLIKKTLSFSEFQPLIPLSPRALELGINPDTWSENLEIPGEVHDPIVFITMACNIDVKLIAKLSTKQEFERSNELSNHIFIYREVSSIEMGKQNVRIRAIVPDAGQYVLDVYACKTSSNNPNKDYHLALSYQIMSKTIIGSQFKLGYPKVYDLAAAAFDFQILHWNSPMPDYCCEISTGELDVVFQAKPELQFYHYMIVSTQETDCPDSVHHFNTFIAQNRCGEQGLYMLRCVFPCQGYWSVYLCATQAVDYDSQQPTISGYTCIFKYHVYVKKSVENKSFPRVIAPYITFHKPLTVSASGSEVLSVQFSSSRLLEFYSYLTFETSTSEPLESYTRVSEFKDIQIEFPKKKYEYHLNVIFPKPGNWYVHLFGRDFTNGDQKYNELFILNVSVKAAITNKRFPTIYSSTANALKFSCCDTGCISFCDDGSPFTYNFKAPGNGIHFIPSITLENKDTSIFDKNYLQRCTLLLPYKTDNCGYYLYTMHAVFPFAGTWSVQLFGRLSCSESNDYDLVLYIQLQVSKPSSNRCYPTIYPAFSDLGFKIPNELLLYDCESSDFEIKLPFYSPENVLFDSRLMQGKDVFVNQTMVRHNRNDNGDYNSSTNRMLHGIFPKTGEWVVYLYADNCSAVQNEILQSETYYEKKAVLELKIRALCSNNKLTFPQIYDPFYSIFSLKLDETLYPLTSRVHYFPSKIILQFYSPPDVKFLHSCKLSTNLDAASITRLESDPQTGLCKLSVEINEYGQWIVTLYAKKSDSPERQKWITVLKHTIQTH